MIMDHEEQISLMSSMEKLHTKVNSENGGSEQGLMESTKIRTGKMTQYLRLSWLDTRKIDFFLQIVMIF